MPPAPPDLIDYYTRQASGPHEHSSRGLLLPVLADLSLLPPKQGSASAPPSGSISSRRGRGSRGVIPMDCSLFHALTQVYDREEEAETQTHGRAGAGVGAGSALYLAEAQGERPPPPPLTCIQATAGLRPWLVFCFLKTLRLYLCLSLSVCLCVLTC
jgi:hypothetical protein